MEPITIIAALIGLVVGGVVFFPLGIRYRKNVSEKEMERLHGIADAASKILTDAYAMRRELTGALSDSGMAIPELEKKDDAAEGAEETENTETTENTENAESEAVTE